MEIVNWFCPGDTTWNQSNWLSLAEAMPYHLFKAKPLPATMMSFWVIWGTKFSEIWIQNRNIFTNENILWNVGCKIIALCSGLNVSSVFWSRMQRGRMGIPLPVSGHKPWNTMPTGWEMRSTRDGNSHELREYYEIDFSKGIFERPYDAFISLHLLKEIKECFVL